jgi:hypothetical protein
MSGQKCAPRQARRARSARVSLVLAGAVAVIALFVRAGTDVAAAQAPNPPAAAAPSADEKSPLPTITVAARRQLQKQLSHYVATVVTHDLHDSLVRWDAPICPLVAGLSRERGEFILARISQIAAAAHVPLAAEKCQPNFYVVVTAEPDELLKRWWRRDPTMYNTNNGFGRLRRFMRTAYPVRCWYNVQFQNGESGPLSPEFLVAGAAVSSSRLEVPTSDVRDGTRLQYSAVQGLASVIMVVDANRTRDLNMGQLADYVAMLGLAQIRLDADLADTPTILRVFQETKNPPQGLSSWDQAFLYSLYNTSRASVMQESIITDSMLERIAPR